MLVKKGYNQLNKPSRKISCCNEERGVYTVTEKKYDVKKRKQKDDIDHINIVSCDPGLKNVITTCTNKLNNSCCPDDIIKHGTFDKIDNEEYSKMVYSKEIRKEETERRNKNKSLYT